MMCSLTALIDRPRIVRTIGILRARAKIGLQNLAYKHSPPGDVGTARRGMKTVESSGEKASREDNRKQDPTRTCAQSYQVSKSNIVRGAHKSKVTSIDLGGIGL